MSATVEFRSVLLLLRIKTMAASTSIIDHIASITTGAVRNNSIQAAISAKPDQPSASLNQFTPVRATRAHAARPNSATSHGLGHPGLASARVQSQIPWISNRSSVPSSGIGKCM